METTEIIEHGQAEPCVLEPDSFWDEPDWDELVSPTQSTVVTPAFNVSLAAAKAMRQREKLPTSELSNYDYAQRLAKERNTKTISYVANDGYKLSLTNFYYDPNKGSMPNKYIYDIELDANAKRIYRNRRPNLDYTNWVNGTKAMETKTEPIFVKEIGVPKLDFEFKDLKFVPIKGYKDGIKALKFFDNKFGAFIQKHEDSHGYDNGNYEVYVIYGTIDDYKFCYDTDITDDYIGNLSEDQVMGILFKISGLRYVSKYEKNTVGWWIYRIADEHVRDRAIAALKATKSDSIFDVKSDNFGNAINYFTWSAEMLKNNNKSGNKYINWGDYRNFKLLPE